MLLVVTKLLGLGLELDPTASINISGALLVGIPGVYSGDLHPTLPPNPFRNRDGLFPGGVVRGSKSLGVMKGAVEAL